jgi:hypothetical protein
VKRAASVAPAVVLLVGAGCAAGRVAWRYPTAATATQRVTVRDGARAETLLASLRYAPTSLQLTLLDPVALLPILTISMDGGVWTQRWYADLPLSPERTQQLAEAVLAVQRAEYRARGDGLVGASGPLRFTLSAPRDFGGCVYPEDLTLQVPSRPELEVDVRTLDVECP